MVVRYTTFTSIFRKRPSKVELNDQIAERCQRAATKYFGLPWESMMRKDRSIPLVRIRRMIYAGIVQLVEMPQVKYSGVMGGRDRSTILNSLNEHKSTTQKTSLGYCHEYSADYKRWIDFLSDQLFQNPSR